MAANWSSGFKASGLGASGFAAASAAEKGSPTRTSDVEQRCRHEATERHIIGRFRSAALASAILLPCFAISAFCACIGAFDLREARIDPGEIAAPAHRRAARLGLVDGSSELFALRARRGEFAAQRGRDFSSASIRAAAAGSGARLADL